MKVEMIKEFVNSKYKLRINKGVVLTVRALGKHPFDLKPDYQIIKGKHLGNIIPYKYFVKVDEEEKIYTEKQWNDKKNHYLKLLETEQKVSREAYSENNKLNVELRNTRGLVRRLTESLMVTDFIHMLNDWLESEYEATEAEDRNNFAKKIVSYLSNVQQI